MTVDGLTRSRAETTARDGDSATPRSSEDADGAAPRSSDDAAAPRASDAVRRRRGLGAAGVAVVVPIGAALTRLPAPVVVPAFVVLLSGLDFVAGVMGKSWAADRSPWMMAAGCALYGGLFALYAVSLRYGELSTVTIAWVVLLTVGDMALDRFYYDVHFSTPKWVAAGAAVLLLCVLLAPDIPED